MLASAVLDRLVVLGMNLRAGARTHAEEHGVAGWQRPRQIRSAFLTVSLGITELSRSADQACRGSQESQIGKQYPLEGGSMTIPGWPRSLLAAVASTALLACAEDVPTLATPPPNEASLVVVPPRSADREPQPIPGGLNIPPLIHIFLPGPVALGFQGEDVEPSVIRDFDGFTALAYLQGSATDRQGNPYHVETDIRVFQGTFVSSDGTRHTGTYVLI